MKAKSTGRPESEVELGGVQLALNGSVSGMFAGGLVTPFDVIKTRMMTADVREEQLRLVEVAKAIWREEGLAGMYRGALVRMGYLCFGGFAFFGIYEKIKKKMNEDL